MPAHVPYGMVWNHADRLALIRCAGRRAGGRWSAGAGDAARRPGAPRRAGDADATCQRPPRLHPAMDSLLSTRTVCCPRVGRTPSPPGVDHPPAAPTRSGRRPPDAGRAGRCGTTAARSTPVSRLSCPSGRRLDPALPAGRHVRAAHLPTDLARPPAAAARRPLRRLGLTAGTARGSDEDRRRPERDAGGADRSRTARRGAERDLSRRRAPAGAAAPSRTRRGRPPSSCRRSRRCGTAS